METVHLLLLGDSPVLRHRVLLPLHPHLLQRQAPREAGRRLHLPLLLRDSLGQLPAEGPSEEEVRDQGKRPRGSGKCNRSSRYFKRLNRLVWFVVNYKCCASQRVDCILQLPSNLQRQDLTIILSQVLSVCCPTCVACQTAAEIEHQTGKGFECSLDFGVND